MKYYSIILILITQSLSSYSDKYFNVYKDKDVTVLFYNRSSIHGKLIHFDSMVVSVESKDRSVIVVERESVKKVYMDWFIKTQNNYISSGILPKYELSENEVLKRYNKSVAIRRKIKTHFLVSTISAGSFLGVAALAQLLEGDYNCPEMGPTCGYDSPVFDVVMKGGAIGSIIFATYGGISIFKMLHYGNRKNSFLEEIKRRKITTTLYIKKMMGINLEFLTNFSL